MNTDKDMIRGEESNHVKVTFSQTGQHETITAHSASAHSATEDVLEKQINGIKVMLSSTTVIVAELSCPASSDNRIKRGVRNTKGVEERVSAETLKAKAEAMKSAASDFKPLKTLGSFEVIDSVHIDTQAVPQESLLAGLDAEIEELEEEHSEERDIAVMNDEDEDSINAEVAEVLRKSRVAFTGSADELLQKLQQSRSQDLEGKRKRRLSGDFIDEEGMDLFDQLPVISETDVEADTEGQEQYYQQEEEAIPEGSVQEEEEVIDKEYYYAEYMALREPHRQEKVKNKFLQKRMSDYYKKRHMEHVLREHHIQFDSIQKYNKLLDKMGELLDLKETETEITQTELDEMKHERDALLAEVTQMTSAMLQTERDIGIGLINRKTGNPIPDKLVEHILRRQRNKVKEVAELRLSFIKLRNMVQEKEEKLRRIEVIAPGGLTLQYYEQLKLDNRIRADKIETQDNEMTRLRARVRDTLQTLAHTREKLAAMSLDVGSMVEQSEEVDMDLTMCRERLGAFRTERDYYRRGCQVVKENSGLLAKPTLLADYEASIDEVIDLQADLSALKRDTLQKTVQVREIRKELEYLKTQKDTRKDRPVRKRTIKKAEQMKAPATAPSMLVPSMPEHVFDHDEFVAFSLRTAHTDEEH